METGATSFEVKGDQDQKWFDKFSKIFGLQTAIQHAVFSGYLSVFVGLIETFLSVTAGENEDSSSLLGIAIMAVAEITGSLLVLYRWKFMSKDTEEMSRLNSARREAIFAGAIAVMMGLLGGMLLHTSMLDLLNYTPGGSVEEGIFVSIFGAITSFILYMYKAKVGAELRSMVLIADAKCSRCVGLISFAVILALFLERVVWWADSATGMALSIYIMWEGWQSFSDARELWLVQAYGDEGVRLVPLMHERFCGSKGSNGEEAALLGRRSKSTDEESGLLEETV